MEQRAGASLFLLYKAIKCQVEKGPVDTFTQEAKYSLSEEGLLRESMPNDYITVTCLVLQRELDEAYHAKVLDCDSITQVKAKILDAVYKNTAFTLRPTVHDVDLEWQCVSFFLLKVLSIILKNKYINSFTTFYIEF